MREFLSARWERLRKRSDEFFKCIVDDGCLLEENAMSRDCRKCMGKYMEASPVRDLVGGVASLDKARLNARVVCKLVVWRQVKDHTLKKNFIARR